MDLPRLRSGFTLIELLIVIAIIGSLAAMIVINFASQANKARDAERKSDLRQYQTALESYANRSGGLYPVAASPVAVSSLCTTLNLSVCPQNVGTPDYQYRSDNSGTKFVLWVTLETKPSDDVYIVCSNGKVGEVPGSSFTGVPAGASCPI